MSPMFVSVGENFQQSITCDHEEDNVQGEFNHSFVKIEPVEVDIPELEYCEWTCSEGTVKIKNENQIQNSEIYSNIEKQDQNNENIDDAPTDEKNLILNHQYQSVIQNNEVFGAKNGSNYSEKNYGDQKSGQEKRLHDIQCQLQELSLLPSAIQNAIDDINKQLNQLVRLLTDSTQHSLENPVEDELKSSAIIQSNESASEDQSIYSDSKIIPESKPFISESVDNTVPEPEPLSSESVENIVLESKPLSSESVENNVQKTEKNDNSTNSDEICTTKETMEPQQNQVNTFQKVNMNLKNPSTYTL